MHPLDALNSYASARRPDRDLAPDLYLLHDPHTVTVFDKFPKAKFHFLVLPRIPWSRPSSTDGGPTDSESDQEMSSSSSAGQTSHPAVPRDALMSLHSLLTTVPATTALYVLKTLQQASLEVVEMVKDEMMKIEGFEWGVQVGFHAVPSMRLLHLHVISKDFIAPTLRVKKHYNSFHPALGFFIPLTEVINALSPPPAGPPSAFNLAKYIRPNGPNSWESILKTELACWRCGERCNTMPALKKHLEGEWAQMKRAGMDSKIDGRSR